ncbi:metallophosphoesterase [Evansella sp. AB-rgal1]|uniref:metallophosphoesterase n=1 Tax=Evansella sp. AB-rgal1 TaxID=3242696 RepID=UPI00359DBE62
MERKLLIFQKHKWIKVFITAVILIGATSIFLYVQNNVLTVTKLEIQSEKLPSNFDGYKIVQLSDLHNKYFGENQKTLIRKVETFEPDIIVFTGDLVDHSKPNLEAGIVLMEGLVELAPVYFVTGNHEWYSTGFSELEEQLETHGVIVLRNTFEQVAMGDQHITILGIDDPMSSPGNDREFINDQLSSITEELGFPDNYTILLSHRPEHLGLYASHEMDLIFSGHAHGGQVRLPFIGGLVAPNQGLFPTYTAGMHELDSSILIVNRGLGNSIIPQRLFNRPEIIVVELVAK